jgi:hypothetical protein
LAGRCALLRRWRFSIQLPYCTKFSTVWEYSDAVAAGHVDWRLELGTDCPICGGQDCWREIAPYERKVIELMPYREGVIVVARFQCRTTGKTFSLLPYWLAPYHQYTVRSIMLALLLAATVDEHRPASLFDVAEKGLEGNCRANGFLLGRWLGMCLSGLHREHLDARAGPNAYAARPRLRISSSWAGPSKLQPRNTQPPRSTPCTV